MAEPELIVAEARRWIGTPYWHQASLCGTGTDCLGLVRGLWRSLYGTEPRQVPAYTRDWGEVGEAEPLMEAARALMHEVPQDAAGAGDMLLFRMRRGAVAKHLGILTSDAVDAPAFVHAYDRVGVVESPLSLAWRRRVAAAFRFP